MIPLHLRVSGFLSYRDPVELDFKSFDLACISGQNGAGKSALLDAITFALFGQARRRDDSVVNLQSKAAEVTLTFEYEGATYRVQRTLPIGKSAVLEFQILGGESWRPLTERTQRETQARIESTLSLDYETFINASFLLQGQADRFAQQNAGQRKQVLGTILGLERWSRYRERASERRHGLEGELAEIEGRLTEIEVELAEEPTRVRRLAELTANLQLLSTARTSQESAVGRARKAAAILEEQGRLVSTLSESVERSRQVLSGLEKRLADKQAERESHLHVLERSEAIDAAYAAWQENRLKLEAWEKIAAKNRGVETDRAPLLQKIAAEQARLEEELRTLLDRQRVAVAENAEIGNLKMQIASEEAALEQVLRRMDLLLEVEQESRHSREELTRLRTQNEHLRPEMDELKARISALKAAAGAECPLCGQPLSPDHRRSTLKFLEEEGKKKGDLHRLNAASIKTLAAEMDKKEAQLSERGALESTRTRLSGGLGQLTAKLEALESTAKHWQTSEHPRLLHVSAALESGQVAPDLQRELARLDKELAKLGYDADQHEAARRRAAELANAEREQRALAMARGASGQIEAELGSLGIDIEGRRNELADQQRQSEAASAAWAAAQSGLPDMQSAEFQLRDLREQENQARDEVGAARQKVEVLKTLSQRAVEYGSLRERRQREVGQLRALERAFGKEGVPALLIEQALPQIEAKADEILGRLSDGKLGIRFATQAAYKDKKREDRKETLDIQISDQAGTREYEMYSGGEAFRINFAIRLALSEILAQRKGARLQTLVIDEGFGSQDAQGRQRLLEAINLVRSDFAKILVITHMDELKDAFPTRIEVEKTERGSTLHVS